MKQPESALEYARQHDQESLEELTAFLRIPSISTLPEHKDDMLQAASWLAEKLQSIQMETVKIMETNGHPVVYAEWMGAGDDAPTLLIYGHYDVQPADPLELWESPPFEPQMRGQDLFARGASDMKGQVVAVVWAVQSQAKLGGLRLNLKFLFEGEEEIGSPSLADFIQQNQALLKSDLCLNCDASILAPDTPSIAYALRGLAYFEIRLKGPKADLHSGLFGGPIVNPATELCRLIGRMHDDQGRVTLPGFYDQVVPLGDRERSDLAELPQTNEWWMAQTGVTALKGEQGYSATEQATARPTLDVNGLLSGFTGEGSKTVLPSEAMAKLSMRLVPNQHPDHVRQGLEQFLQTHVSPGIAWELMDKAGATPAIIDRGSQAVQAAADALQAIWGKPPLFTRQGGTVPVVSLIQDLLGVDSLMLGFGLPDDNLHAPNEKLHLPNFRRGIETYIRFLDGYAG